MSQDEKGSLSTKNSEKPLHQILRFGIVGIGATLIHVIAAYIANKNFQFGPFSSNLFGYGCAVLASYLGHHQYTFEMSGNHHSHIPKFLFASALCLVVSNAIVAVSALSLELDYVYALLGIFIVVPPSSFIISRLWVFQNISSSE
jgi:putative flippase GtrA